MVSAVSQPHPTSRTIWGLEPIQLNTRFWAAHGVQVVRQGEPSQIVKHAELFLLTDPRSLVIFKLAPVMEVLNWIQPQVLFLRLHDIRERGYREKVVTDPSDRFVRFQRLYESADRLARVVLTPEREIAQLWQSASDPLNGWRRLRRFTPRIDRVTISVDGQVYDRGVDREVAHFLHDLVRDWKRPDSTISRATRSEQQIWRDPQATIEADAKLIGPVWIGAGRTVPAGTTVIGPAVVWDDPEARPANEAIQWLTIEPKPRPEEMAPRKLPFASRTAKRAFDIFFALCALAFTLPIYPFVMLAIWLEDGRPFFFSHRRETIGGREFGCVKFRSMRKDAEKIKAQLKLLNQADGPQFYMENDPRLTRVGKWLRKYNLDELPQFWNVLVGDMSIVGPRPSPEKENQYCPPWREARLSVRPGITGLWQIRRTRRQGNDFQEWIKYDLEYVEKASWRLDMVILFKTVLTMIRKGTRQ
ncbi:MAG TPA: sugar transferase [Tepidisphaeraceae bacterium]|jgi:lipopolysaccharide/colanic/teichoic acid biosynthesis glycosyltransferase|nr:sugar transferase [Tepidisphaeraceae bacterium]